MTALTENDRIRIAEAVQRAEAHTSGEIVCILAKQVSSYPETPLAWAALVSLAAPPLALALGADPMEIAGRFNQWSVGHGAAADDMALWMLTAYGLVQAALFAVTALVVSLPPVRRLLTPPGLKARRVKRAAMNVYAATGLNASPERTGVVIFAALEEHRVEVVADEKINARCAGEPWDEAVAAIRHGMRSGKPGDGFVQAVEICGAALGEHFPDDAGPNKAPDRPVEL